MSCSNKIIDFHAPRIRNLNLKLSDQTPTSKCLFKLREGKQIEQMFIKSSLSAMNIVPIFDCFRNKILLTFSALRLLAQAVKISCKCRGTEHRINN